MAKPTKNKEFAALIPEVSEAPKELKQPPDWVQPEGHMRPVCWVREHCYDWAEIFQNRVTTNDLRSLAAWCLNTAEYLDQEKNKIKKAQEAHEALAAERAKKTIS